MTYYTTSGTDGKVPTSRSSEILEELLGKGVVLLAAHNIVHSAQLGFAKVYDLALECGADMTG